jgi:hypothetical protein
LPLMTKNIYKDQKFYIDVAAYNELDGFRNIQTGIKLFFPPAQ